MNKYERLRSMTIDDMAGYLDACWSHDDDPSMEWWNKKYCNNCEPVYKYAECFNREVDFAWCEVNGGQCKYFPELDGLPDNRQIMKMWLESDENE